MKKKKGTTIRGSRFTEEEVEEKKDLICKLLMEDKGSVTILDVCELVGISNKTFYNWRDEDTSFHERVKTARAYLEAIGEDTIRKRMEMENLTCDGIKSPVDTTKWYLERRSPKYKEKKQTELTAEITTYAQLADAVADEDADK